MPDKERKQNFDFDRFKDVISGIFFACLSLALLAGAAQIKGHAQSGIVNAQFMPRIIGGGMLICSMIVVIQSLGKLRAEKAGSVQEEMTDAADEGGQMKDEVVPLFISIVLMLFYAAAFKPLGFILSSAIFVFGQINLLTIRERRTKKGLLLSAVTAVVVSVSVYIAFRYGLDILLPAGILG